MVLVASGMGLVFVSVPLAVGARYGAQHRNTVRIAGPPRWPWRRRRWDSSTYRH